MPSTTPDTPKVYAFSAPLDYVGGFLNMYGVTFPHNVEELWGTRGTVRVCVQLLGLELRRSLIPAGDGTHYLMVSKPLRKAHKLEEGDMVTVRLWLDPEPMVAEMPEELEIALEMEPDAKAFYDQLTLGVRRNIGIYIEQAKRPETRAKRAADMINRLLKDHFTFGGRSIPRKK